MKGTSRVGLEQCTGFSVDRGLKSYLKEINFKFLSRFLSGHIEAFAQPKTPSVFIPFRVVLVSNNHDHNYVTHSTMLHETALFSKIGCGFNENLIPLRPQANSGRAWALSGIEKRLVITPNFNTWMVNIISFSGQEGMQGACGATIWSFVIIDSVPFSGWWQNHSISNAIETFQMLSSPVHHFIHQPQPVSLFANRPIAVNKAIISRDRCAAQKSMRSYSLCQVKQNELRC